MKKIIAILAAAAALVSCQSLIEEWQPVLGSPQAPEHTHLYSDTALPDGAPAIGSFKTIKELEEVDRSFHEELEEIRIALKNK